jgi:hypothetical protein
MTFFRQVISDLRQKRLLPVAAGLLAALVAVPALLSTSSSGTPVAQLPQVAPATALPATALPAVSVSSTPTYSRLGGHSRDPFAQPRLPRSKTSSTASSTTSAAKSSGTSSSKASGTSTTSGGAGATTTTTTTTTTPGTTIIPTGTPHPAPTGLTSTQSYHVILSITNSAGGVDTVDPLQRLSILPSQKKPLLVELGVLKGGQRVLFAVQPGTVLTGAGTCTPGPIDCEILSLGQDQVEGLAVRSSTGTVPVALFAVTGITADQHASPAAADNARRIASAAGRDLLSSSTLSTLSLFQYEPSLGAVVDQRNVTVGGS